MKTAIVFDTEVNSFEAKECIDLAWVEINDPSYAPMSPHQIKSAYFNPTGKIEAGAIAVHGIIPQHVDNCPPSAEAKIPESEYVIGHKVDFDCEVLKVEGPKRICTLALSQYLWPEFKSHSLTAMIIELMGATYRTLDEIKNAHSAETDVRLTLVLLRKILTKTGIRSLEELYQLSEVARIPSIIRFGMHRGARFVDLPRDYITFMLRKNDLDPYVRIAFERALVPEETK